MRITALFALILSTTGVVAQPIEQFGPYKYRTNGANAQTWQKLTIGNAASHVESTTCKNTQRVDQSEFWQCQQTRKVEPVVAAAPFVYWRENGTRFQLNTSTKRLAIFQDDKLTILFPDSQDWNETPVLR